MTYRLLALDLDGTLLNSQGKVGDRDAEALQALAAKGVMIAPATVRWYQAGSRFSSAAYAFSFCSPNASATGCAVAMGNSTPDALAAATFAVSTADDGGVAEAIERLWG